MGEITEMKLAEEIALLKAKDIKIKDELKKIVKILVTSIPSVDWTVDKLQALIEEPK